MDDQGRREDGLFDAREDHPRRDERKHGDAYAWIGAALGYRVKLCMPKNASEERKKILRAYGVEFVFTDPDEGSDGAIREVRRLYAEDPEHYYYPDQYSNPANPRAHYRVDGAGDLGADERRGHALRRRG